MRSIAIGAVAALLLAVPACTSNPAEAAAERRAPEDGRLMPPEKLADSVWYMRQPPRIWSAVIGNVGIVEQSDGVVLIDTGGSIPDGRDVVAELAKLTAKPVKAVAITHWHNDHPLGVPGILEKYPKARIIATAETARLMAEIMGRNTAVGRNDPEMDRTRRESTLQRVAEYQAQAKDPKLSADERREHAIEAAWVAARLERQMGNFTALPTETFADSLRLDDPVAPVELRFLGAANTAGDLVAWLPRQRILFTGDAVVAPSPYGFNASVGSWRSVLEKMKATDFALLVPGHGAVQSDSRYLDTMIWSMNDAEAQVRAAIAKGLTQEQALEAFDDSRHAQRFGADTGWAKRWLGGYWLAPIASSIYREQTTGKVMEGS